MQNCDLIAISNFTMEGFFTSGTIRKKSLIYSVVAVRLGRCPKKEKPHTSLMVPLPQDDAGSIDLERQSSLEQMVLHIHESFQKANMEFYKLVQNTIPQEVRIFDSIKFICFTTSNDKKFRLIRFIVYLLKLYLSPVVAQS